MTSKITCVKCKEEKDGLESAPLGGPTGQKVLESVCGECWHEWQETSARLINHHGLTLANPEHRKQLREAMRDFLSLNEDSSPGTDG